MRTLYTAAMTYFVLVNAPRHGKPIGQEEVFRLLPILKNDMSDLLTYGLKVRAADDPQSVEIPKRLAAVGQFADAQSTTVWDWMKDLAIGFVIGHEFAHVEQLACPRPAPTPWEPLMRSYEDLACGMTSRAEVTADLRGLQLIRGLMSSLRSSATVDVIQAQIAQDGNLGPEDRDALSWMASNFDLVQFVLTQNFGEVETLLDMFGDQAPAVLAGEPEFKGTAEAVTAIAAYYSSQAKQAGVWSQGRAYRNHMFPAYRYSVLFPPNQLFQYGNAHGVVAKPGLRLTGLLFGGLDRLQDKCDRSPDEQAQRVRVLIDFLRKGGVDTLL
jgi:hypothetical protein